MCNKVLNEVQIDIIKLIKTQTFESPELLINPLTPEMLPLILKYHTLFNVP